MHIEWVSRDMTAILNISLLTVLPASIRVKST